MDLKELRADTILQAFLAIRENDLSLLRAVLVKAVRTTTEEVEWNGFPAAEKSQRLLSRPFPPPHIAVTFMHLALALNHTDIANELCSNWGFMAEDGAVHAQCPIGNAELATELCPWQVMEGFYRSSSRLMLLAEATDLPIPMVYAAGVSGHVSEEFQEFCRTSGRVRWDVSCLGNLFRITQQLLADVHHHGYVLQLPCRSADAWQSRMLLLQIGLSSSRAQLSCYRTRLVSSSETAVFLQHGASAMGWTRPRIATVIRVCKEAKSRWGVQGGSQNDDDAPRHFVADLLATLSAITDSCHPAASLHLCERCCAATGICATRLSVRERHFGRDFPVTVLPLFSMLPPILAFLAESGNIYERAEFLLAAANVPWLKSLNQIPYANGLLHDGPTCDHAELTAEQRQVSLPMCFRSGGVLETLQLLSRDAILSSLLHHNGIIAGVEQLPLPASMKRFLLS